MTLETRRNNREAFGLTTNVMTATNVEKLVEHSWHHLSVEKVARLLETDLEIGLSSDVSAQRREILGPNQLTAQKQQSPWLRFFQQLNQPLIYILLASGIVTAFLKEWIDSGVIFGVALTNATIGFVQESKAENAIAALAKSVATEATILRNGQKQVVSSSELVPGDLVLLSSGDKVSADLRLIEVRDLQVDEQGEAIALNPAPIEQAVDRMAKKGLRVLALAKKVVPASQSSIEHSDIEQGLTFLGLQGMIDPPRPEAIQAIQACRSAGIQVKMITGDHAKTAAAIAHQMGLNQTQEAPVFTGQELAQMNQQELANAVEQSCVFARVAPEQKLRIVEALQSKGEIVAITGDGVNDAPALKQADIGVAMGITGTEVTKEAADMILTDDNFASIEKAVEEGRTVYKNLLRAIAFILPVNGGESMTILIAVLLATPLPILPVQILWLNMVSSVALSLPLAFEPPSPDVMQQPPRPANEPLLSRRLTARILTVSVFNWIAIFGMFEWIVQTTGNEALARTMAIQALVAAEAFYLLSISRFVPAIVAKLRGKDESVGYAVAIGIGAIFILQFLFSQWGMMNLLFDTQALNPIQGLICIGFGLPMIALSALLKRFAPLN
jgi:Ca2+-transporting ATPase